MVLDSWTANGGQLACVEVQTRSCLLKGENVIVDVGLAPPTAHLTELLDLF